MFCSSYMYMHIHAYTCIHMYTSIHPAAQDFEAVSEYCSSAYGAALQQQQLAVSGGNWGAVGIAGSSLKMARDGKVRGEGGVGGGGWRSRLGRSGCGGALGAVDRSPLPEPLLPPLPASPRPLIPRSCLRSRCQT